MKMRKYATSLMEWRQDSL